MKKLHIFPVSAAVLVCLSSVVKATPLSPADVASLQQREQRMSHLTFDWNVTTEETSPPASQDDRQALQRAVREQLPDQLRKHGMTDDKAIQKTMQQMVNNVPQMVQGYSQTFTAPFKFQRSDDQTLVSGAVQQGVGLAAYRQFYDGESGLIVNDESHNSDGQKVPTLSPQAWLHKGGSARYSCPFTQNLHLSAEHFVMLAGFDPLALYGTEWDVVSTTDKQWVLQTQFKDSRLIPIMIQMTLDRDHGDALQQLHFEQRHRSVDWQAISYRRYDGEWICDSAKVIDKNPGILTRTQSWTLSAVKLSAPITVTLAENLAVADYRLLGSDFRTRGLFGELSADQAQNVVYYPWPGHFPKLDDLKKQQGEQHPGEAVPDPGKSASLPLLGGIMALVGGVWMFKRRSSGGV